jgi:hypothetical protein
MIVASVSAAPAAAMRENDATLLLAPTHRSFRALRPWAGKWRKLLLN